MSLYQTLIDFKEGKAKPIDIEYADSDGIIDYVRINNNNLGKTLLKLKFSDEEFYKLFMGEESYEQNINVIHACKGYYHGGYLFVDEYSGQEDFKEGYVFHYFNDENMGLLRKIVSLIDPTLSDFQNDHNDYSTVSKTLLQFFPYLDEIGYDYATYLDDSMKIGCLEYIESKLCNKFQNYGIIEKRCMNEYLTTVDILLSFWDKVGADKESTLLTMLRGFIENNNLEFDEDLYEDYYSYQSNENFDNESFNREANRILEKTLEKAEEEFDEETLKNMRKFQKILKKLNMKVGNYYAFPREKNFGKPNIGSFQIRGFEDGEILIWNQSPTGYERMKMNPDDFYNFLYHPELF